MEGSNNWGSSRNWQCSPFIYLSWVIMVSLCLTSTFNIILLIYSFFFFLSNRLFWFLRVSAPLHFLFLICLPWKWPLWSRPLWPPLLSYRSKPLLLIISISLYCLRENSESRDLVDPAHLFVLAHNKISHSTVYGFIVDQNANQVAK